MVGNNDMQPVRLQPSLRGYLMPSPEARLKLHRVIVETV